MKGNDLNLEALVGGATRALKSSFDFTPVNRAWLGTSNSEAEKMLSASIKTGVVESFEKPSRATNMGSWNHVVFPMLSEL